MALAAAQSPAQVFLLKKLNAVAGNCCVQNWPGLAKTESTSLDAGGESPGACRMLRQLSP